MSIVWARSGTVASDDIGMEQGGNVGVAASNGHTTANINITVRDNCTSAVKWSVDWAAILGKTEDGSVWEACSVSRSHGVNDVSREYSSVLISTLGRDAGWGTVIMQSSSSLRMA